MEKICSHSICTGCGVCVAQCPSQSISMCVDSGLGHVFPHINQATCIDCGLCEKKCPALHPPQGVKPIFAYAAWSKDEEDYKNQHKNLTCFNFPKDAFIN